MTSQTSTSTPLSKQQSVANTLEGARVIAPFQGRGCHFKSTVQFKPSLLTAQPVSRSLASTPRLNSTSTR